MKRLTTILIASLMLVTGTSQANPRHHYGHHGHHGHVRNADWIAPLVIGSVVTYALTRPQPIVVQQPQQVYPNILPVPYGYRYEHILDANCNCYRLVLVQNQP
jgi:hypothetical protein